MALGFGPNIVMNGLVLNLDSANLRSYGGSGSSWGDLSKKNQVTLYNTPGYSSTNYGNLSFANTSTQYAETTTNFQSLSTWTVEVWVRFNAIPASGTDVSALITGLYNGSNAVNFTLGVIGVPADGLIRAGFFDGSWRQTSGHQPVAGTWYHYVGTYDGTNITLYVNGVQFSQTAYTGTPTSGGTVRIARRWDSTATSSNFTDGPIPIARIYNRALTSTEVLQNYNALKNRFIDVPTQYPNLQLWVDGNDISTLRQLSTATSGVASSGDSIGYIKDKSGNNNNLLQATTSVRPTLHKATDTPNMIKFNGSNQLIELSSALTVGETTIVWAGILDETPNNTVAILHGTGTADALNMYTAGYYWYQAPADILQANGSSTLWKSSTMTISEIRRQSGVWNIKHNNSNVTITTSTSTSGVIKGLGRAYSGYSQIRVGEVLVYNRYLSDMEMSGIRSYLNTKWGAF